MSKVSFPVFYMMWAKMKGWKVPDCHLVVCQWLNDMPEGEESVLMAFRGFSKSTILGIYNAWRIYLNPEYRILHQGDKDDTAYKCSRDTKSILKRHPLCTKLTNIKGDTKFWWSSGATDERNPTFQAAGITSNITSSRADEIQNDDVEVPRNIATAEARETLRYKLGEQTHISVPWTRTLYIGTPHTHDSLYDEKIRGGARHLLIPLYAQEHRIERIESSQVKVPFEPEVVFANIYSQAELLAEGIDYTYQDGYLHFNRPVDGVVDLYCGNAWPDRFGTMESLKRRRKCRTLGEWDSQYQLHSKPIGEVRLDPTLLKIYSDECELIRANNDVALRIGTNYMVGCSAYWDCALGKVDGDKSVLSIVYTDGKGWLYWHDVIELKGELEAQCEQIKVAVTKYSIPCITVESSGLGGFVPPILRKVVKPLGCSVRDVKPSTNKNTRILSSIEPALSGGFLWAHERIVQSGIAFDQMRNFNPTTKNNEDDYIDSLAGAIELTPVRIGKHTVAIDDIIGDNWRPAGGVHEASFEFNPSLH